MAISGSNGEEGFSLIELLVATALLLVVMSTVLALADPMRGAAQVQLESGDLQQRLRVAASALRTDLAMAGAGIRSGPLTYWFAPVLPYRVGGTAADLPGSYRTDAVTVFYVPAASPQTTLAAALGPGQLTLMVRQDSGCPLNEPLCGFRAGTTLLVIDGLGHADTLVLTSTTGNSGQVIVDSRDGSLQVSYGAGATVVPIVQRTYYLKTNPADGSRQLVYDEPPTHDAVPVVDHVTGLTFEYYGDPTPPAIIQPIDGPRGPWTTYGPPPPASGEQPTAYPPGENCAFLIDPVDGTVASRLPRLTGDPGEHALVTLTAAELADADVWCPDGAAATRFDADLLRVRRIGVTIRVESAIDALRGPAGALFNRGGTARDGRRFLPDREIRFDVTPSNLNLGASP